MLTLKEVAATLEAHAQTQPPEIAEALQIAAKLCRDRAEREEALEQALKRGDPIWYVDYDTGFFFESREDAEAALQCGY